MKRPATPMIRSLSTLVELRSREVERLQADTAAKEAVRQRYQKSLQRLESLCTDSGVSGAGGTLAPMLSVNCGNYKQTVMEMADAHRLELTLHEADMAVTQRALTAAWCKQQVLGKVLERQQLCMTNAREKAEQKRQDELAMQMWNRENL